ncbi:MAG TPA: phosphate ABC transporter substrate-binding protein [Casimicrobiaceae bacterium]|nr:phosphate ABC transporter substrate-binding protein [Casimicrobiaceae bacterium]
MAKWKLAALAVALVIPVLALGQTSSQSQPTEESKKLPTGSAAERKERMKARANQPAYTKKFDLSGLPSYVPEDKPTGTLRVCGNNYVGDSPLGGWLKEAFEKLQPGIKIEYNLPSAAIAVPCMYFGLADIGINHEPSFYDYLGFLRLKGYEPTGFSVLTGSYNYVGWQNNLVIIVNKDNPITKVTMKQLDGMFGSVRDGGWVGSNWHPEMKRGADQDVRTWGQMGLSGEWASRRITPHGYALRYATAIEFSNKVLQASDKWNGDLHTYANYKRPDGTTYLEADQIFDAVRKDPGAIGYARYHEGFPKDIKILAVAKDDASPPVPYNIDTLQKREYPLWGDQSFWVDVKPGGRMDPKVREFVRFVLSREGQELVQKDGKYLPLTAEVAREELARVK